MLFNQSYFADNLLEFFYWLFGHKEYAQNWNLYTLNFVKQIIDEKTIKDLTKNKNKQNDRDVSDNKRKSVLSILENNFKNMTNQNFYDVAFSVLGSIWDAKVFSKMDEELGRAIYNNGIDGDVKDQDVLLKENINGTKFDEFFQEEINQFLSDNSNNEDNFKDILKSNTNVICEKIEKAAYKNLAKIISLFEVEIGLKLAEKYRN